MSFVGSRPFNDTPNLSYVSMDFETSNRHIEASFLQADLKDISVSSAVQ